MKYEITICLAEGVQSTHKAEFKTNQELNEHRETIREAFKYDKRYKGMIVRKDPDYLIAQLVSLGVPIADNL